MKIALLLSGQIRNAKESFSSIKSNILDAYETDVYINTWLPENQTASTWGYVVENDCSIDELISQYKPKKILVEDFDKKRESIDPFFSGISSEFPETRVPVIFYMHYKNKGAFNLIDNPEEYDFIIKSRMDLVFENFPDLKSLDPRKMYVPYGSNWRGGIGDLMAFSNCENMKHYFSLYDKIPDYVKEGCPVHPETILKYHLGKKDFAIERPFIKYYLRGNPCWGNH